MRTGVVFGSQERTAMKIERVVAATLLIATLSAGTLFGQGDDPLEGLKGRELYLRETLNSNRKIYVRHEEDVAYYIHSRSRLFPVRKPERVRIHQVLKPAEGRTHYEVQFSSQHLGKGKIRIYGTSYRHRSSLVRAAIDSAFSELQDAPPDLILNTKSRVVHFAGSNHLPPKDQSEKVNHAVFASDDGVQKCPLCFFNVPQISGFDVEMRLSEQLASAIRDRYPLVPDSEMQYQIQAVGNRVLSRWVLPLKGYRYSFYAVDSPYPNAFACPGGKIFITTGLLETLESDMELEAVMAHEVAHMELRHGYRQYRSALKAATLGGIAAGIVAGLGGGVHTEAANWAVVMAQLASSIVLTGYARKYEEEADMFATMYFESNEELSGLSSFSRALRKLQYNQDFYDPQGKSSSLLATHPKIDDRIELVEEGENAPFAREDTFYGYDTADNLVATVSFLGQRVHPKVGLRVLALVESTSALEKGSKIKEMNITIGRRRIKIDNKEDTEILPNDEVGVSFVTKNMRSLISGIDKISLDLHNVNRWERSVAVSSN